MGGQEHRQPLRRARDGVVGLRQFARHTGGLHHVRGERAEGGGDAEKDERAEARSALLRLRLSPGGIYIRSGCRTRMHIVCGLRHTMPNRAQVAVEREEL